MSLVRAISCDSPWLPRWVGRSKQRLTFDEALELGLAFVSEKLIREFTGTKPSNWKKWSVTKRTTSRNLTSGASGRSVRGDPLSFVWTTSRGTSRHLLFR